MHKVPHNIMLKGCVYPYYRLISSFGIAVVNGFSGQRAARRGGDMQKEVTVNLAWFFTYTSLQMTCFVSVNGRKYPSIYHAEELLEKLFQNNFTSHACSSSFYYEAF